MSISAVSFTKTCSFMLHYVVLGVAFMKYSSTIVYQQFEDLM